MKDSRLFAKHGDNHVHHWTGKNKITKLSCSGLLPTQTIIGYLEPGAAFSYKIA